MTDKQLKYADLIKQGVKPVDAAKAAGYSIRSAPQIASALAHNPKIQAIIADDAREAPEIGIYTREDIMRKLSEIAEGMPTQGTRAVTVRERLQALAQLAEMIEPGEDWPEEDLTPIYVECTRNFESAHSPTE